MGTPFGVVETMHFYKDCALYEDKCKVHKGAFALSVLRSIVLNILHLNQVQNIARKIAQATYDLHEALAPLIFVTIIVKQCYLDVTYSIAVQILYWQHPNILIEFFFKSPFNRKECSCIGTGTPTARP